MKRMSVFYLTRQKKAKDLIKDMETIEVQYQRKKLKKLLEQRKNRWKQINSSKQIQQKNFNYLKKKYSQFSLVQSNASKEKFITEKIKRKIQSTDRAYCSQSNIKVGAAHQTFKSISEIEDSQILNRKFLEYDKKIDQQSAQKKIENLEIQKAQLYVISMNRKKNMKKTYFQKFLPDKYNFYTINQYSSLKGTVLTRSKTDRQMQSRLETSKIKKNMSTLDGQRSNQCSMVENLKNSRSKNGVKLEEFIQYRSRLKKNLQRSRIKSHNNTVGLQPISLQKNLNSIQY